MAKTSSSTPPGAVAVPVTIDDLRREVEQADSRREQAGAALSAVEVKLARVRLLTDRHLRAQRDDPQPDPEEYYQALADRAHLERSHAERKVAAIRAGQEADAALKAWRRAQLAELTPRKRAAVERLDRVLGEARREVDALARIEDEEVVISGGVERLASAWNTLASGSPSYEATLDCWRRSVRSYGFDLGSTG